MFNRFLYLAYYVKETDWRKFRRFVQHVKRSRSKRWFHDFLLWSDIIFCSWIYNMSIMDYFYFRFFLYKSRTMRRSFAGTGFMYEYQLKMNPIASRAVLENKIQFLKRYQPFVKRQFATYAELDKGITPDRIWSNPSGKMVVKGSKGQVGAEVQVVSTSQFTAHSLLIYMQKNRFDLLEEYVVQHRDLMRLSSAGLNTVRVFTQIYAGKLFLLGARLRITIHTAVDNMAAGNIAAPIALDTGIVCGPGVFSDITKDDVYVHPLSGETIVGFQVPLWKECMQLVEKLAFHTSENRSIGWDIAITETGCEVIEGNHNWCKLLWQLPVKKGLKEELTPFI